MSTSTQPGSNARWAIITGASSGIGRALAFEFAKGGFNVLLTGRNAAALAEVCAACEQQFHVEAESVAADLSRAESVDSLIASIAARPRRYEVLVNNAGFGIHGAFASSDIGLDLELVRVQLDAAMKLTRAVLPSMLASRSGKILNVASVYGFAPVPYQSVYSACKAFLVSFSASLRNELEGTGVHVTVFCPGITKSEFRSRAGIADTHKSTGMTAEEAARIAYAGTIAGKDIVVPGFLNKLFVVASRLLPAGSFANVVKRINRLRGLSQ